MFDARIKCTQTGWQPSPHYYYYCTHTLALVQTNKAQASKQTQYMCEHAVEYIAISGQRLGEERAPLNKFKMLPIWAMNILI